MATISEHAEIEKQLALQIVRLNARIARLIAEKEKLEKLIIAHRSEHLPKRGVIRRNAIDKVTTTSLIISILRDASRPMKVSEIAEAVKSKIPTLNDSTFRSYIHRLYQEGTIASRGGRGSYALTADENLTIQRKPRKIVIRRN